MARKPTATVSGNDPDNGPDADDVDGQSRSTGSENIVDPASIEYGDEFERDATGNLVYGASGKPRRKRGRKSGGNIGGTGTASKNGTRNNKNIKEGLDTLSKTLMIVHMGIASYTKFDGFNIEEKEADALSASIANVMEQFDWTPDPKFAAIAGLVTTGATIYGPRIYMYTEHVKATKAKAKDETNIKTFGLVNDSQITVNR